LIPNKGKIAIFAILVIVSFTFGVERHAFQPQLPSLNPPYTKTIFNPILWLPYGLGSNCPGSELFCYIEWSTETKLSDLISKTPNFFLATLIYWYILSCLIIFLHGKRKKK
jgi:hypothetical protein